MRWTALTTLAIVASMTVSAMAGTALEQIGSPQSPLRDGDRVVFLGDSITAQGRRPKFGYISIFEAAVRKSGKKVDVIGAGVSGNRVPDLQKRLERDVTSKKPTIVWIYIGINDVWHSIHGRGTPKAQYEAGLKDLIAKIRAAGATVVLATPSVIGEKPDGQNKLDKMLDEYAQVSRDVAKETGVTLCDLHSLFINYEKEHNAQGEPKGVLTRDGVHLTTVGNQFVAEQAAQCIAQAAAARK